MTFEMHLRSRGADGLLALLDARPDLSAPPPSSVRALAARAGTRASLDRALARLDARTLAAVEAVAALEATASHPGGPLVGDVATAIEVPTDQAAAAVATAAAAALVWPAGADGDQLRLAPGVADALGPHPAGLGPTLELSLARRSPQALADLAAALGTSASPEPAVLAAHLADPRVVRELLADAPPAARAVLEALTWGPPVGRRPADGPAAGAVAWLMSRGLLGGGDPQHVTLPREVALALRGGRTRPTPALPPIPAPTVVPQATAAAESARQAAELVRLTALLIAQWGAEQPGVLRSGGLGVRELRRLARALEVDEQRAALVVEVAAAAGLVADDGEAPPAWCPTTAADDWLALAVPERWPPLAAAWLGADRAAWLVGSRDEAGAVRTALDAGLRRPWAPRLRTAVLTVLAQDGALDAAAVHEVLAWRTPRAAPAPHAVEAVLGEATAIGVVGAGALAPAGAALLAGRDEAEVAAALAAALPPEVDEVLLGADLTGVVPGQPTAALAALLELVGRVESRGAGLTVRFTQDSVRRALDTGRTGDDLLAALAAHARGPVPQPLTYLVGDTARRHGEVRVGLATSYLRGEPAALAGLEADPTLATLGLLRLAPTVLAAQAPPATLVAALRARGLPAVAEDGSGNLLHVTDAPRRVRARRGAGSGARPGAGSIPRSRPTPTAAPGGADERRLRRVVADLLAGDARERAAPPTAPPVPEPLVALEVLRDAVARGTEVWLDLVGPQGTVRRRVRPLRVDAGRVRALDAEREAEIVVAVHRVAHAAPVEPPVPVDPAPAPGAPAPAPAPAPTELTTGRTAR